MQDFNKLSVWQKAHDVAVNVFRLTATIPRQEVIEVRRMLIGLQKKLDPSRFKVAHS